MGADERAIRTFVSELLDARWHPKPPRIDPAAWPTLYPISHDALMGSSLIAGWLAEVGR